MTDCRCVVCTERDGSRALAYQIKVSGEVLVVNLNATVQTPIESRIRSD